VKKRLAEKGLKKSGKMPRVYEQINEKSQIPLGKIISGNRCASAQGTDAATACSRWRQPSVR